MADNWAGGPEGTLRWGQLTYASFDPDSGAGGWQVTSTAGDLSDGEIEALRQRIVTRFDSDILLGACPNAAELQAMPRRLTYINDGQGRVAYFPWDIDRTFWEVLAPAPVITRRRASRMTPAPERLPSVARLVTLAVVAVGAFVVQATRLWQMVP